MYMYIYIYHIYTILNNGKNATKFQVSRTQEFHVNYFTIFSLITTLSTDVTKSLQCKGISLSDVT